MADFMGAAYLRYSFTKGTDQEVDFLARALGLSPGQRLLDVGCGPGRHAAGFCRLGVEVAGLDLSARFLEVASAGRDRAGTAGGERGHFVRGDARRLPFPADAFDAAVSLCQGGFGLVGAEDHRVLGEVAGVLRPGGLLALTAFSAYFAVRFLERGESFDAEAGIQHERTVIRSEEGAERDVDLWTSCFTPRELRLLAMAAGLEPLAIWSVAPGDYADRPPDLEHPEFLLLARKREVGCASAASSEATGSP